MSETPTSHEIFMDIAIKKLEAHTGKIAALEKTVNEQLQHAETLQIIKTDLSAIKEVLKEVPHLSDSLQQFSSDLTTGMPLLRQLAENNIRHHHHVPGMVWAAAGLFLALALACAGWFNTAQKLDQYRAADTQYRYLKLESDSGMQQKIEQVDSLYQSGYAMRDSVVRWEKDIQQATELHQRLQQKRKEGAYLKDALDKLEHQNQDRRKNLYTLSQQI